MRRRASSFFKSVYQSFSEYVWHRQRGPSAPRTQLEVVQLEIREVLTAPVVSLLTPAANSITTPVDPTIQATFDQNILPGSVSDQTFVVQGTQSGRLLTVNGDSLTVSGPTISLDPANEFFAGEVVQVTATTGIQNAASEGAVPHVWQFRTATAASTGQFVESGQTPETHGGSAVALGDIDGDGDLDAVVASVDPYVLKNHGLGTFERTQALHPPVEPSHGTTDVKLGDLDGDGDLDVFVTQYLAADRVWLNDGLGNFTDSGQSLADLGSTQAAVDLGDLDGDGDLDAFVGNNGRSNQVWLNNGAGIFVSSGQSFGNDATQAVTLGDVDGDGDLDAVQGNLNQPNRLWLNSGVGAFVASAQTFDARATRDVALGDLDGDGDLDLWEANEGQPNRVWVNNGSGAFANSGQAIGNSATRGVALGDVDGDGDLDAYLGNYTDPNRIWRNNGAGVFVASDQLPSPGYAVGIGLGDFDGDSDLDAFEANGSILINGHPGEHSADLQITLSNGQSGATPDSAITYTMVVTNAGPDAAPLTWIDADFSESLTGATWTAVYNGGAGGPTQATGYETYHINTAVDLPAGASVIFTVTGRARTSPADFLTQTAEVRPGPTTADADLSNNSAVDSDPLVPVADLSVSISDGQQSVIVGSAVTYTIQVSNWSVYNVTGISVTSVIPPALQGVSWTASFVNGTGAASGSGTLNELISLAAGGTATYRLSGTVSTGASGSLTVSTAVSAPAPIDIYLHNNIASDVNALIGQAFVSIGDATILEGNSGTSNAVFTVTRSGNTNLTVTVIYGTADDTATVAGNDYTATSNSITFGAGETTKTITVAVKGDTRYELSETFLVNLTGYSNATITDGTGVGIITNDDPTPALTIQDVSVTEGNSGTKVFTFAAILSAASNQVVTVDYATADGSATAGADYASAAGTLTFLAGQTSRTFTVTVTGDASAEADETFVVTLGNATNALLLDSQAVGTILNDDTSLAIDNVSVAEGDSGATAVTFTVSLSAPVGHEVRVHYATANGTAAAGSDYVAQSGNLVFAAGQTTQTITVLVLAETRHEPDQTILVNLTAPVGALIADSQGVATIVNDDALPSVSVADFTVVEGNSGSKTVYFTLSLSAASGQTVSVGYTTADGSASGGSDYVAESGTVNIAAGATTATVGIVVYGDTVFEGDETFLLQLSNPTNAAIADGVGVATLGEDDSLKINDVTVSEGDSGAFALTFTVSLEQALDHDVTVDYATANSTAAAASDYIAASGKVTIAAGQTSATLTVLGISDLRNDADRAFKVNLTNAVGAVLADSQGTGTIVDNDPLPTVTIGDVVIAEGNSSTKNVTFTVSLSAASNRAVAVTYATADGSATAGSDYVAKSGTVNIGAGLLSATVTVVVNGDTANEGDEAFLVDLIAATYGTLVDNQAQAVLANDDPQPLVSIADAPKAFEGNSGTKTLSFTVSLSAAATQTVTVSYATANGSATAGSDYTAQSGQLIFTAGQLSKTVTIVVAVDTVREADETFFVNLTAVTNAGILDAQGVGTVQNDDTSIVISDAAVDEGNSGTTTATFTVSIAQAVSYDVQVSYATANSTAAVGNDYLAASGLVVIPAGQTSQTITVFVVGDANDDADEAFLVNLTNPINAILGDAQGVGTIRDDDALPGVTITDVVITEGQAGTKSAVFTVNLAAPSNRTVSVNYTTANGTATAASDYVAKSGTVNITAGSLAQTITIVLNGDAVAEGDEAFFVNLSGVVNGTLVDSQGVGTLTDDDSLKFSDATATETDAGTFAVTYTVSIAQALGYDLTVDYATADGTADAGMDYLAASGSVTILAGQTTATITILGVGDVINEANETILVNLTNGGGLAIADSQGTGTLVENDPLPSLTITDVVVTEGNAGTKNVTFVATLSAASGRVVAFNYSTADGSASAAAGDYVAKTSSLSIAAGALSGSFTVVVNGDTAVESDETFLVNFSNVSNATLTTSQAQATVVNDDFSGGAFALASRQLAGATVLAASGPATTSGLGLQSIGSLPAFLPDLSEPSANQPSTERTAAASGVVVRSPLSLASGSAEEVDWTSWEFIAVSTDLEDAIDTAR